MKKRQILALTAITMLAACGGGSSDVTEQTANVEAQITEVADDADSVTPSSTTTEETDAQETGADNEEKTQAEIEAEEVAAAALALAVAATLAEEAAATLAAEEAATEASALAASEAEAARVAAQAEALAVEAEAARVAEEVAAAALATAEAEAEAARIEAEAEAARIEAEAEAEAARIEAEALAQAEADAEPDHVVKINFDGVTAYALDFEMTDRGRVQVNALFENDGLSMKDAQCKITLISGITEVDYSYISVDDMAGLDIVPDSTTFLDDGINLDSFDTVRLSGCFTSESRPEIQTTSEPDFDYKDRVAFEGIEVFAIGFGYSQFGRFEVNGLVRNYSSGTVDAQCRLTLISGNYVVADNYISADDVAQGESVPDTSGFLEDSLSENSFDRVRLSGCFTY